MRILQYIIGQLGTFFVTLPKLSDPHPHPPPGLAPNNDQNDRSFTNKRRPRIITTQRN